MTPEKPESVRKFNSCWEMLENWPKVREEIFSGKLFITNFAFGAAMRMNSK